MEVLTIARLKETANEQAITAAVHAQLQSRSVRSTKSGKPYLDIAFADATGSFVLKAWSDTVFYERINELKDEAMLCLTGEWTQNSYGLNGNVSDWRLLDADECAVFLAGDPALMEKQQRDFDEIATFCAGIADPRFRLLTESFLTQYGKQFRRTAAARTNHHARRGGLVEHVAQMMRSANAIAGVYPYLNRDLLLAGVLFHDCGKLFENCYPEHSFAQSISLYGEALGHIPLGIEFVNSLWRDLLEKPEAADWKALKPSNEKARIHLLHLVASHHGEYAFGSPTLPRTPEAFALHYIDNLDAKLEMVKDAYANANELAPGIFDKVFPLPSRLLEPLAKMDES